MIQFVEYQNRERPTEDEPIDIYRLFTIYRMFFFFVPYRPDQYFISNEKIKQTTVCVCVYFLFNLLLFCSLSECGFFFFFLSIFDFYQKPCIEEDQ